ncbi:receptor like protein 19 [Prunus dulcis]|uniref:Receptor like protein 19 n=1 Tax=Prunus dulcis TaxID=3755 RepID=A0A4Y1RNY6_PRUDU|nr:receptor like protein 19 [Prunus dulcis]BBN68841.1 receptor like protein 19 [Prunus dulcis]
MLLLGTGMVTQDTSSSVLLFFDKQKFIFNVVERWSFVVLDRAVWLVLSVLLSKGVKTSIKEKKNHEESAKQSSPN